MVTHQTASLTTAKACGRSQPLARSSRSIVSRIAVIVQPSAPPSAGGSLAFSRFHATRQRAEQKRACSRRGVKSTPHCSQFLLSDTTPMLRVTNPLTWAAARIAGMNIW